MPVRIVVEDGPWRDVSLADIRRRALRMLAAAQCSDGELSILLTGDDQIQKLNKVYRNKNKATDVLAFAQREGERGDKAGGLLGDVVVSIPTARRQATAASKELRAELTMLLAHGLLHLLGWDHETPAKDKRMRQETDRLCAAASKPSAPAAVARLKGRTRSGANADSRRLGPARSKAR